MGESASTHDPYDGDPSKKLIHLTHWPIRPIVYSGSLHCMMYVVQAPGDALWSIRSTLQHQLCLCRPSRGPRRHYVFNVSVLLCVRVYVESRVGFTRCEVGLGGRVTVAMTRHNSIAFQHKISYCRAHETASFSHHYQYFLSFGIN